MNVFLSPHNDDEVLFGAFALLRERPRVVVVFRSAKQADMPSRVTAVERERETDAAMLQLGCEWEQWPFLDTGFVEEALRQQLLAFDAGHYVEAVWAPAVEPDGHDQHNVVGRLAREVFGGRVVPYLTYTRGGGRSRNGQEVAYEPQWVAWKLAALACYQSQMREPSCLPWFLTPDLREWTA